MSVSHKKTALLNRGRNRKTRMKSFKIESNVVEYAKSLGIEEYTIKNYGTENKPKLKIIVK